MDQTRSLGRALTVLARGAATIVAAPALAPTVSVASPDGTVVADDDGRLTYAVRTDGVKQGIGAMRTGRVMRARSGIDAP